jgi:hypothetical protein
MFQKPDNRTLMLIAGAGIGAGVMTFSILTAANGGGLSCVTR